MIPWQSDWQKLKFSCLQNKMKNKKILKFIKFQDLFYFYKVVKNGKFGNSSLTNNRKYSKYFLLFTKIIRCRLESIYLAVASSYSLAVASSYSLPSSSKITTLMLSSDFEDRVILVSFLSAL